MKGKDRIMLEHTQAAKTARRDRIVLEHLPMVKAIAARLHQNLPAHVDLDDLVHAGVLGLIQAADKFNPAREVAFSSYARHRIKGAILDGLRQLDWASRDLRRRQKAIEAALLELTAVLERAPAEPEIAEKLGIDVERLRRIMVDLRSVTLISASRRSPEHDDLPTPDLPCSSAYHADSRCLQHELSEAIQNSLHVLLPRSQEVIRLYYEGGLTMKEIGVRLRVNESRISQIHAIALQKMREAMQLAGIDSVKAFAAAA